MSWIRRRWKLLLVGLVAVIGIGVVAVPYVYIHFINKPEPRLTFENLDKERAGHTTAAEGPSTSVTDGTWTVVAPSTAGYRVKETLNGQDTEGVGRTDTVDGTFTISGTSVTAGEFNVDVSSLTSDQGRRDSQVRDRLLETDEFPVATFVLDQPISLDGIPDDAVTITTTANGTLSLHGVDKPVTLAIEARRAGEAIEVLATTEITFADFGIDNPSISPFVSVGEVGTLEVALKLTRAAA